MDADSICNDFHLRMTVATTEHERFEQLLSVLVPTPDTVVSAKNLEAINDACNVVFEAFAAVIEAYEELDDCADELDLDESKVMEDAYATVKRWSEEIDQVMVQIKQIVWDSQHGHIKRLITGSHSRSGKRTFRNPAEEPAVVAAVTVEEESVESDEEATEEESDEEETDTECEVFESEDEEDFTEDPTEESVESDEEATEEESVETGEESEEESDEVVETAEEVTEGESEEAVIITDEPEEPAVEESAEVPSITITQEELTRICAEAEEKGYQAGTAEALAKLAEIEKADKTADLIAAESKPLARKPKTTKPKAEAKPAKPAKTKAPAKKEDADNTEAKPAKKRGFLRKKKEASE